MQTVCLKKVTQGLRQVLLSYLPSKHTLSTRHEDGSGGEHVYEKLEDDESLN